MLKRTIISTAIAMSLPGIALADLEISGEIKNETSVFTSSGLLTGDAKTMLDGSDSHDSGDVMKFQNQGRMFVNGDIGEESSWHAELNVIVDTEAIDDYEDYKLYSQHDYLRELYVDTNVGKVDLRLGKQQVVWGTADGMKLLDIINPTDWREFVQNTMEDSRIPIWMIKAEADVGESGNFQFIVSQREENKIPGLNSDGDSGHAFIMKGVDSITGPVNGFLNVSPALANVASSFHNAAFGGAFTGGAANPAGLNPFTGLTVDGFASNPDVDATTTPGLVTIGGGNGTPGYFALNGIAQNGLAPGDPNGNNNVTNLMPVTGALPNQVTWNPADASSAFEYMPNATFATFNTFAGNLGTGGTLDSINTSYKRDYPDDENMNAGFRFRGSTDGGFNYSLNYFYHYSANPTVNLSWHDSVTGQELVTELRNPGTSVGPGATLPDGALVSQDNVPNAISPTGANTVTVLLRNPATNQYYGAVNPDFVGALGSAGLSSNSAQLRFTEELHRVHSIGASFDTSIDAPALDVPIVIRGEFLYDDDDKQPIIDKRLLSIGDLSNALVMEDADMFKYVIGVDVTVLTNLMISGQFIQFRNLDYEDDDRTCTTQTGIAFDCSRYTGDMATLNMTNGMNQGEENENFYSLFFSKPFGPSDEHRWNNITMYEEDGGWWNRFDVEYTFTDELIGSFEWNQYWGDEDTMLGQFDESSNLQVGIKYIFD